MFLLTEFDNKVNINIRKNKNLVARKCQPKCIIFIKGDNLAQLSQLRGEFLLGGSGLGVSREGAVSYKFLFFEGSFYVVKGSVDFGGEFGGAAALA